MATTATWDVPAGARYGLPQGGPATRAQTEMAAMVTPSVEREHAGSWWHPDSPLLWIGGFAAVTFGLMAFSTSVRVGKTRVSASVGQA